MGLIYADESWKVYDDSEIAIVNITLDQDDLEWMYDWENVESDSLHPASIHFQNAYINETIDSIGFRLRGNTSRVAAKKSFKVDFNHFISGRDFFGVEKLNLNGENNDPSIIRSKISWDLFQRIGMVSSRAAHAKVYINGSYYGLYVSVEHLDDTFLSRNYDNDNGNLWKCLWPADLTYRGNDPEDYHPYYDEQRPYALKTNQDEYDYGKLARLIRIIDHSPDSLRLVLDIKEALQYFAMNIITGGWDDYRFLRNNFYLYHDPSDDLMHWIPYDYDNTLSIDWFDTDWSTIDPYDYAVIDNDGRPLTDHLFSQDRYRDLFSHFLQFYSDRLLDIDELEIKLEQMVDFLYAAAEEDQYRVLDYGFSMDDFVSSYGYEFELDHVKQGMLRFFSERRSSLDEQISYGSNLPTIYDVEKENEIIIEGDTVRIKISMFGDPVNFHLFYAREGEQTWNSIIPTFQPNSFSDRVEDHDLYVAEFIPEGVGNYYWYLLAGNEGGSDRFPIYDFMTFQVIEEVFERPVIINELLAKNETINMDESGEFDDWIELHNYSNDEVIDLSGFFLTDRSDNLTKWQFPDSGSMIEPLGHMLIWCDEDQEQGDLHANFKLSSNGEFLGLVLPDGETLLDSINFPSQQQDISYGRISEDQDDWGYLNPTPGSSNTGLNVQDEPLADAFQLQRLYPNPFNSDLKLDLYVNEPINELSLDLISLTGQIMESRVIDLTGIGHLKIPIDFNTRFASGCYLLRIKGLEKMITRKVIYLK